MAEIEDSLSLQHSVTREAPRHTWYDKLRDDNSVLAEVAAEPEQEIPGDVAVLTRVSPVTQAVTYQLVLTPNVPVQITVKSPFRRLLALIPNDSSGSDIYIAPTAGGLLAQSAFRLPAGMEAPYEINCIAEWWACIYTGTQTLCVMEYSEGNG